MVAIFTLLHGRSPAYRKKGVEVSGYRLEGKLDNVGT